MYLWGDVNRDGDVDLYDLLTLQQYLAKNITLTETQLLISDVTKDDKVDLYDSFDTTTVFGSKYNEL